MKRGTAGLQQINNPYAVNDTELLKADNGKFLNLIGIKGKI